MRLPTATGATMSCTRGRTTSSASPALGLTAAGETERIGDRRPRAARRGSGRAGASGCGTRRGPSRPAASGGTRKRAARRPSSNQSVAASRGVARLPRFSTSEVDAALAADVEAVGSHAPAHRQLGWGLEPQPAARPRPRARARRSPSTSISSVPRRKLPTTSPSAAPSERPAASGEGDRASSRARWAGPRWPRRECSAAARARHRHRRQDRAHDVVGGDAAQLGVGREQQPVLEHRGEHALHVVGDHVVAAEARGERAGGALQRERRRAGSRRARGRGGGGSRRRGRRCSRAARARRARGRPAPAASATSTALATGSSVVDGAPTRSPCASRIASSASRSG